MRNFNQFFDNFWVLWIWNTIKYYWICSEYLFSSRKRHFLLVFTPNSNYAFFAIRDKITMIKLTVSCLSWESTNFCSLIQSGWDTNKWWIYPFVTFLALILRGLFHLVFSILSIQSVYPPYRLILGVGQPPLQTV